MPSNVDDLTPRTIPTDPPEESTAEDRPHNLASEADAAAAGIARVEVEVDHLWRDSLAGDDHQVSDALVDASHALARATRRLEQDRAIG